MWKMCRRGWQRYRRQQLLGVRQHLQMPLVEVWIAVLLGGFVLEQRGEFYEVGAIWLSGSVNSE